VEECYKLLGIQPDASVAEIKTAFRRKAKLLHPDLSKENSADTKAFQKILKAYQTLISLRGNSMFDESFRSRYSRGSKSEESFDYRKWLSERTDEESRCKLVFFDLMHGREDDAVAEYKEISVSRVDFSLSKWFTREDFMDYGFILSEELVLRNEYYDAFVLLEQIIRMEHTYEYFRLFFPEVMDLARTVLKYRIDGKINDELALDSWERALELGFGNKDDAFFLRKMAAAYRRLGDTHTARICEEEAERLG